jgi:hypothetical protein
MTAVPTAPAVPAPPAPGRRPGVLSSPRWWVAAEFAGLVAFQVFHQTEHTLELLQKRFRVDSVGPLLSGVSFEWMHFGGNTILLIGCVAVLLAVGRSGRARWRALNPVAWWVFVGAVALQGSHVAEHVVRVVQYVGGEAEPDGFATQWLDPVWFHWGINLAFLFGLVVGFLGLEVDRDLLGRRRR